MLAGRYTLLDHSALATFMPDCERRGISVLMAAPFNSGILATGARPDATFFYTTADAAIMARTRAIAPRAFWDELEHRQLIAADAPIPAGA